jgi:hypothetical protein
VGVEEDGAWGDDERDDEKAESIRPPCSVCFDSVTIRSISCGPGGHTVCERCLLRLVDDALVLSTARIACPDTTGCGRFFAPSNTARLLPPKTQKSYEKVKHNEDLKLDAQKSGGMELVGCPSCGYSQIRPTQNAAGVPVNTVRECTHCHSPICFDCCQLGHALNACGEEASRRLGDDDEETRILREFQMKIPESLILFCKQCSSRESSPPLVGVINGTDSQPLCSGSHCKERRSTCLIHCRANYLLTVPAFQVQQGDVCEVRATCVRSLPCTAGDWIYPFC